MTGPQTVAIDIIMDSVEIGKLIGRRVLVSVGLGPQCTVMKEMSPNREYVNLVSDSAETEYIGWAKADKVRVLDIFLDNAELTRERERVG